MNHRIAENFQNCNEKIRNFQFWSNFKEKYLNSLFNFFLVYSKIINIRCSVET